MQVWFTIYLIIKALFTFPMKFWNKVRNTTNMKRDFLDVYTILNRI